MKYGPGICAGNSSSGIKETPAFGCPTVNIGSRQSGRLRASNVIDVGYQEDEIFDAFNKALFDGEFRKQCSQVINPYGLGNAGNRIAEILAKIPLDLSLTQNKMSF